MSDEDTFTGAVDISDQRRSLLRRLRTYALTARAIDPDWLRERRAERLTARSERRWLAEARDGRDVCWTDDTDEPLVTIRIATYHRPKALMERAIASALRQSYERIEILVVGDGCTDDTASLVSSIHDDRVRFVNLGRRTLYPATPRDRWLVSGYEPLNIATVLARGDWLTTCDDDDELASDHVETLLTAARARHLEFVWSKAAIAVGNGEWVLLGHPRFRQGHVTHGSALYSAGLRFMRYSGTSYRLNEPLDWNLFKRMAAIGVRMGFVDAVTYRYFPSDMSAQIFRAKASAKSRR